MLNQSHGQLGGVHGNIHLFQHIGQRPDMVLVAMSEHKSLHLLDIILQIGDIRDHQVNAQHVILRKCQTAVHDNNTVSVFKGSNIHPDLLQSA